VSADGSVAPVVMTDVTFAQYFRFLNATGTFATGTQFNKAHSIWFEALPTYGNTWSCLRMDNTEPWFPYL
jgi:hypothetical protein